MSQPGAIGAIAPTIKLRGRELPAIQLQQLTSLKVELSLNQTSRLTLRFDDTLLAIAASDDVKPGSQVEISSQGTVLFKGEVTGVNVAYLGGRVDFVVVADDLSYKMGLGSKATTYAQQSAADLIRTLAGRYSLRAATDGGGTLMPYLLHTGSDLSLLNDLASRAGCDWWVDGDTLHFAKPAPLSAALVTELTCGEEIREFSVQASSLHPGKTEVTGWEVAHKQPLSANDSVGAQTTIRADGALVSNFVTASALQRNSAILESGSNPSSLAEARSLAASLTVRWASQAVSARGACVAVYPQLRPGNYVLIKAIGPAGGYYPVTAVTHLYDRRGFRTEFVSGDRRPSSLADQLGGPGGPGDPSYDGMVIGVVTALANGQSDAQPAGCVKVKFPTLGEQVESNWARVVAVGAGSQRGVTFSPEVNDEVLVGFENGDPTKPVVLGGLYNPVDVPTDFGRENGKIVRRRITSGLGHVLEFGDGAQPSAQYLSLTLAGDKHHLKLGKEALDIAVPSGCPVNVVAGNTSIKVNQSGDLTLAGQKITLKATGQLELSGSTVAIKASTSAEMSGAQVSVKGSATAELSAGGQTSVKGAMVAIN